MVGLDMSDRSDARRYLENWQDEVDSAAEYRAMAASEPDPRLAKVYVNLAAMEEGHIAFWEERLRSAGARVPPRRASWRSRVLGAIARRLGPDLVLATIAAKEAVDQHGYLRQPETAGTKERQIVGDLLLRHLQHQVLYHHFLDLLAEVFFGHGGAVYLLGK